MRSVPGEARKGEDGLTELRVEASGVKHSSSGYGAIAQLGERVLCKHEVVGSIPSGSTSLRSRSERRRPYADAMDRRSPKGEGGSVAASYGSASRCIE